MLKTNSKKLKVKIENYLKDGWGDYLLDNPKMASFEYKEGIKKIFELEKPKTNIYNQLIYNSNYERFKDWMCGLCSAIYSNYYYNISAVELVGDLLEQTQEERNKYTEEQAEELMTRLLYNCLFVW